MNTRDDLVDRYRQRIRHGKRTRLQKDELEQFINGFINKLSDLTTKAKIKALCQAEIALLEEGYPKATIGKVYLPMYRTTIREYMQKGLLPMTKATSRQYTYQKRNTGEVGFAIDHLALDFLKYDQTTYESFAPDHSRSSSSPSPHTPPFDQFEHLEEQISRIWSRINANDHQPHTNIDELAAAHDRIESLEKLLADSNQRIRSLESELSIALRGNLSYQKQIEQLTTILKPLPTRSKQRVPTRDKITAAIDAIMLWNGRNDQKFAISQTLLLKATGCNLPAIKRVLLEFANLIDDHHSRLGIHPRHQSKNIDPILEFIESQPLPKK